MWKSIQINQQNIIAETGKSVLIAMPHKSEFDGYCFWHSRKLVRQGYNSSALKISYTENFTFYLKKYGKGTYNSNIVLDEIPISYDELEEAFRVINANICAPKKKNDYETRKPAEIEAVKIEADASLVDEDLPF